MLTDAQADQIIAVQAQYSLERNAGTNVVRTDDAALRKAWLKKHFASFEYHERMLEIHAYWLALIYTALARPEVQRSHPAGYMMFMGPAKKIFDKAPKPGQLNPAQWEPGKQTGWARSILDYGRDSGLDVASTWEWMTSAESERMNPLWGYMAQMAENIQYTVDESWDQDPLDAEWILDEDYTGPIDWPANWQARQAHP